MPLVMWPMGTLSTGVSGIKGLPHVAADLAVQFADAVGGAGNFQAPARSCKTIPARSSDRRGPGP